jgi:hypothetical protein
VHMPVIGLAQAEPLAGHRERKRGDHLLQAVTRVRP